MKKAIILTLACVCLSGGLFPVELGLIGGTLTNPSHLTYGIGTSVGFFVPMVKLEFELCRKTKIEEPEPPNVATAAIKFRPKFGRLWPYAVVGVGAELKKIFEFGDYETFTFVGAGVHYQMVAVVSLRADIRFLNFSDYNRTRISGGLFFHF